MDCKEIMEKINSSNKITVEKTRDIPHGKSLLLNNGGIINCYNSGKYVVQGKNQDDIKAILGDITVHNNRKIFVVYGHDDIARTQLEALLRRWDLEPIILDQLKCYTERAVDKHPKIW